MEREGPEALPKGTVSEVFLGADEGEDFRETLLAEGDTLVASVIDDKAGNAHHVVGILQGRD